MVPNGRYRNDLTTCLFIIVAAAVACRPDAPTAAGAPVTLERVSGDGQSAPPGEALDRPLVARLLDADGRAVRRAEVRWIASAGDVTPSVSVTDANGEARAVWRLGTTSGAQRVTALADGLAPIDFVAFVDPNELPGRLPLRPIDLATYDGSGQAVHPDVVTPPAGVPNEPARLAITPYPWGNANYENPSIYVGNARDTWNVPDGVTNPIVKTAGGYLSDPDMLWLEDQREFVLFYRHVSDANEILETESADGTRWGPSRVVVRVPSHQAVSPTVVRRGTNDWLMWTVNSGAVGCGSSSTTVELRRSTDGIAWSAATTVSMSQPGVFP